MKVLGRLERPMRSGTLSMYSCMVAKAVCIEGYREFDLTGLHESNI